MKKQKKSSMKRGLREEESSDVEREERELETPAPCVSGAHGMVCIVPFKFFFFFFVINIFFSHTTSPHNIHSKQTKQNNRHILHVLKVQSKGEREGGKK